MTESPWWAQDDPWLWSCWEGGFSVDQAAALDREREELGSPARVSRHALRHRPWVRALTHWHRRLRRAVLAVHTLDQWQAYQAQWGSDWHGPHVNAEGVLVRGQARAFLAIHWGQLAKGALNEDFEAHGHDWHGPPSDMSWEELARRRMARRGVLATLLDAFPDAPACSWGHALAQTGLRAVRWSATEPDDPALCRRIPGLLVAAQAALVAPLGLEGPVLGLEGATTLVLAMGDRLPGSGRVVLDVAHLGQQLWVDDWQVFAHEWLHTLDATLARRAQHTQHWMTLGLHDDDPWLPEDPALAAACEAWWTQVVRVEFEPLPAAVIARLRQEVQRWPERVVATLGASVELTAFLDDEHRRMARLDWSEGEARRRWHHWLAMHRPIVDARTIWRTATLFAAEQALAYDPTRWDEQSPLWTAFLRSVAPDAVAPMSPTAQAGHREYLTHPLELMARSFEAAFARTGSDNPLWAGRHSAAGMIWPLPAERAHQAEGWRACMQTLQAIWPVHPSALPVRSTKAVRPKR